MDSTVHVAMSFGACIADEPYEEFSSLRWPGEKNCMHAPNWDYSLLWPEGADVTDAFDPFFGLRLSFRVRT